MPSGLETGKYDQKMKINISINDPLFFLRTFEHRMFANRMFKKQKKNYSPSLGPSLDRARSVLGLIIVLHSIENVNYYSTRSPAINNNNRPTHIFNNTERTTNFFFFFYSNGFFRFFFYLKYDKK